MQVSTTATVRLSRSDGKLKYLYWSVCEDRSEGREDVDSESTLFFIERDGVRVGSCYGEERDEVKTEQRRCKLDHRQKLHLTPCDWEP